MTSKTSASKKAATHASTVAALAPWAWFAELGCQQLVAANESSAVLQRGFEAMCRDFAAAQADLVRGEFPAAARYWQQIAATGVEVGSELVDCAIRMVNTEDALAAVHALDA